MTIDLETARLIKQLPRAQRCVMCRINSPFVHSVEVYDPLYEDWYFSFQCIWCMGPEMASDLGYSEEELRSYGVT